MPTTPPQQRSNGDVLQGREELVELLAQALGGGLDAVPLGLDGRAPVVDRAPAAEGDAAVPGDLEVVDGQPLRLHDEAAAPADLLPLGLGQRGGQHDLGVHGEDLPLVAGQGRQVRLARQHDHVGGDVAAGSCASTGFGLEVVAGDRGALVDGRPEALDGPGQAPYQATGVDGGEGLGEQRGPGVVDLDQLGRLARLQPPVEVRVPELGHLLVDVAERLHLVAAPGQHQHPVAVQVGVDVVALRPRPRPRSMVSTRASWVARVASLPWRAIISVWLTEISGDSQPPLRPDAPHPAISRSTRTTFRLGSRSSRYSAVHSAV